MAEPVSSEDISNHPWLSVWNTIDQNGKIDILRAKVTELEDLIGTASVILITVISISVILLIIMLISGLRGGSVSMSDVSQIGGLVKQFTGK
jgi:hypothetical protein